MRRRGPSAEVCKSRYRPARYYQGREIRKQPCASVETGQGEQDETEPPTAGRCSNKGAGNGVGGSERTWLPGGDGHTYKFLKNGRG